MNLTITDKNGNKRTIELTEDKEKLGGGVDDKLVIIKDGKKYYAPLVEKPSEEKYPRMYVIKKDGIKRYVGEIQKIPSGKLKSPKITAGSIEANNICFGFLTGAFKVPEGITQLKSEELGVLLLVKPSQILYIDIQVEPYCDPYAPSALPPNMAQIAFIEFNREKKFKNNGVLTNGENLFFEYSKEINKLINKKYEIIDLTKLGSLTEGEYNKTSDNEKFERIDDIKSVCSI